MRGLPIAIVPKANERRQRAIENSIASRQSVAARTHMVERQVCLTLYEYVQKV
jgi:hypothetical protein